VVPFLGSMWFLSIALSLRMDSSQGKNYLMEILEKLREIKLLMLMLIKF